MSAGRALKPTTEQRERRAMRIMGTITYKGEDSAFSIEDDGGWQQWGASTERLGMTVEHMETIARALMEEGLLDPEDPDEDEDD